MTESSSKIFAEKKVGIVLAPFSGGQPKSGVENGPKYLMKQGLRQGIESLGWKTSVEEPLAGRDFEAGKDDEKDVHGIMKRPNLVGDATKLIYESVKKVVHEDKLALTLGGDHSIAIGTVAGVLDKYPNAGLLWIDAHADINTPSTTESGNIHGCPVSFVMGLDSENTPPSLKWVPKCLKPNKLACLHRPKRRRCGRKKNLEGEQHCSLLHVPR